MHNNRRRPLLNRLSPPSEDMGRRSTGNGLSSVAPERAFADRGAPANCAGEHMWMFRMNLKTVLKKHVKA